MVLHREQLDKIAHNGCQVPGCKHKDHDPVVFLHSRCHLDGQVDASFSKPNQLTITCGKCNKHITDIAVKETKGFKRCHIAAPLEISYREGSGFLEVTCNECKALLGKLEVA